MSQSMSDWLEVKERLVGFATSGAGKLELQKIAVCRNAEEARFTMRCVEQAGEVLSGGTRPFAESLDLFESWHSRLRKKAVLTVLELRDLRSFCLEILALHSTLQNHSNEWATQRRQQLVDAEPPLSAIEQVITPSGEIRSDASETLYRLFREKDQLRKQIESTLDRLVSAHEMREYLQDRYVTTREGRWVLPVRSGRQHAVTGVIHGSSQTKQTVYMEPEAVVPLNNRLRQIEVEIEEEIERILLQLSNYLGTLGEDFASSRQALLEADMRFACAQFATVLDAHSVEFSPDEFSLVDGVHPLLQLREKKPVANSVRLEPSTGILLLSGPNAGGKTVLLKTLGLAAEMARHGLLVCAKPESRIPFFTTILSGIGDAQSVFTELSTFAAHLELLQEAIGLQGPQNLVLLDEICGATDPEEGSALARAFLEEMGRRQVYAVVTSHLGPLKAGWRPEDRVVSGSLEVDTKSGQPTYRYLQGLPGDSLAIQTARRVGVARPIVDRATELLQPETRSRLAGLDQIEQLRSDIQVLQEHLRMEQKHAREEAEKLKAERAQLERDKADVLTRLQKETEREINELISQAKAVDSFRRHSELEQIKVQLPEIIKNRPAGQSSASSSAPPATAKEFAERVPTGTRVFVSSLRQDGIVQSAPNAKGEVIVLAGSMRLSLPWQELKPAAQPNNPTFEVLRKAGHWAQAAAAGKSGSGNSDRSLDLRGKTVEEALSELEKTLDDASVRGEDRIKIVHGHGTEALKRAVRTHLSRSSLVKKWKAGSPEQGGDGVTWAEIEAIS